ncbi:ATP-binding Cassette (ABC) Superfamily [Trachipleistophora hominis]|uniref:ATP-binding Cassette (ABC) Superfamily n=1 Tax=Trachipleistophora hominis TaxID=72359 RepID=L7JV73_TRAHO|nr:ATP-binding Cassette (ABC) Superfamily [Trachipleistophora hominis]
MKLEWLNVSVHARNKNKRSKDKYITLLNKACGCATQGLTAVMGPSGCGKTTLISTLAGRVPSSTKTSGCVLYNEKERNSSVWMNSVGFVDQDHAFFEGLTAYETVYYAARFKLKGQNVNIETKIAKLFEKLRIIDIMNCKMRILSGGERKRVMIAVELVSDPQIVFLDEPTSGLDNDVAFSIVELLKEVAQEGKIVIMSIHQPDDRLSLLLDKIILMSHGEIIATGTMQECQEYLMHNGYEKRDNTTFSSFAMEVLGNPSLKYNENGKDCKLEKLASSYRNQFVYDKKYQNTRVGSDFCMRCTPNLMDIGVLINRRMKLDVFRMKTFILYAIIIAIMIAIFSFGVLDNFVFNVSDKSADKFDDVLALIRVVNWFVLRLICNIEEVLIIIIAFTFNSVFNSEQRNIRREISAYSYTIVSYHLSVLIFELIYHLPLITCYLCATLYKYTPKQGIGFVIGCQLLRYWVIVNFGFLLISIFSGYKASIFFSHCRDVILLRCTPSQRPKSYAV